MIDKHSRIGQRPAGLTTALRRWITGFGMYLLVGVIMRLSVDQMSRVPKFIALPLATAFGISLVLIIVSTVSVILKLKSELKDDDLTSKQSLVGSLALASFTAASLSLLLSWLIPAALILGIISIRRSNFLEKNDLQHIKIYRTVSLVSIAAASVNVLLSAIIASVQ